MHLARARVEQHRHDLARRVAAHDRVVDDDDALAGDLGERVELQPDALLAQALLGLDERPADVAVLDQPLAERDPASRVRSRSRRACPSRGSAGRGRPRPAPPPRAARPCARARRAPRRLRAASRAGRGRRTRRCRARRRPAARRPATDAHAVVVDEHELAAAAPRARTRAPTRSSAHVSDATTQSSPSRPRHERPEPVRVAEREQPCPPRARRPSSAPSSRRIVARDRVLERRRRRSRSAPRSARCRTWMVTRRPRAASSSRSSLGVDQVAVVAERDRARARRGGRSAARSPSASSRSSSSACGRSRARRAGRAASARRTPA